MTTYTKTFNCVIYFNSGASRRALLDFSVDAETHEVQRPKHWWGQWESVSVYADGKLIKNFKR